MHVILSTSTDLTRSRWQNGQESQLPPDTHMDARMHRWADNPDASDSIYTTGISITKHFERMLKITLLASMMQTSLLHIYLHIKTHRH